MKLFIRLLLVTLCGIAAPAQAQAQVPEEIRGLFNIFVRESNARNVAAVGQLMHDSRDLLWVSPRGCVAHGRDAALQVLTSSAATPWRMEPDFAALRVTSLGETALRLSVPVKITNGSDPAAKAEPYLLTQEFVKTALGWRISSSVPAPLAN